MLTSYNHLLKLMLCVCLGMSAEVIATDASEPSRVFPVGTNINLEFREALRLSDDTLLMVGGSNDLSWVPESVPKTQLDGFGGSNSASSGRTAFIMHISEDFETIHGIYHAPAGKFIDFRRIRTTSQPGHPTGVIYVSATRNTSHHSSDGYAIARLNGNVVNQALTAAQWVFDVDAPPRTAGGYTGTSAYKELQSWDVFADERVIALSGAENDHDWAEALILDAQGARTTLPNWRTHWGTNHLGADVKWFGSLDTFPGTATRSNLLLKATRRGSARSHRYSEFVTIQPDGMGGWRQGMWPEDIYMRRPDLDTWTASTAGRGYNGYQAANATWGPSLMEIDRRDGSFYIGGNVQTTHSDGIADFEPAVMAFNGDGSLRWWSRLYSEMNTTAGAYRSTDGGTSWTAAAGIDRPTLRAITYAYGSNQSLFAGGQYDLLHSANDGSTWSVVATLPGQILHLEPVSGQVSQVWVATTHGLYHWNGNAAISLDFPGFDLPQVGHEGSVTVVRENPAAGGGLIVGTGGGGVWRRSTTGEWTQTTGMGDTGSLTQFVYDIVGVPGSLNTLWIGTEDGVYQSTDGGASATKITTSGMTSSSASGGQIFAIRFAPSDSNRVYLGTGDGIRISSNAGETWGPSGSLGTAGPQIRALAVHPTQPDTIYVGTQYSGLFRSTNGGSNVNQIGYAPEDEQDRLPRASNTSNRVGRPMVYDIAINPSTPNIVQVAMIGVANNSIPDQYVDAIAVDYSQSVENSNILVIARAHGGDHTRFWTSNNIPESVFPNRPGYAFDHTLGNSGNVHISWMGRLRASDGAMRAGNWLAEYPQDGEFGNANHSEPNLDRWPNFNAGWKSVNTTRIGGRRPHIDHESGQVLITAFGRHVLTTRNAYQRMSHPRWPTQINSVNSSHSFIIEEFIGRDTIQPGAATLRFRSGGQNGRTVTITEFDIGTGTVTVSDNYNHGNDLPLAGDQVELNEGLGIWANFVRVYDPLLTTVTYSSILAGVWDRAEGGGHAEVTLFGALPRANGPNDGIITFGSMVGDGQPLPITRKPSWASYGGNHSGVLASLAVNVPIIMRNLLISYQRGIDYMHLELERLENSDVQEQQNGPVEWSYPRNQSATIIASPIIESPN